jgi:hypothetical protein
MILKISNEIVFKKQSRKYTTIESLQENLQCQIKTTLNRVLNETFAKFLFYVNKWYHD